MNTYTFTIAVVGDSAVGKTAFIHRLATGDFIKEHQPTPLISADTLTGLPEIVLEFLTNIGQIQMRVIEHSGDQHYIGTDAFMVMFDLTNKSTLNPSIKKVRRAKKIEQSKPGCVTPVVWAGNKVDCGDRQVKPREINPRVLGVKYFDVSSKSCYNLEAPFLYLARELFKDQSIHFVTGPAVAPPEVRPDWTKVDPVQ